MSKITITKGKILKGDKVEIDFVKLNNSKAKPAECSETHTDVPHEDLRNAFAALAIHAALRGEFIATSAVKDISNPEPKLFKDFTVTGFTITGGEDDPGVILTAHKTLKAGGTLGFNTPVTRYADESKAAYPFMKELEQAVELCCDEIREYLNGKYAPDPQGDLFEQGKEKPTKAAKKKKDDTEEVVPESF